MMKTVDELIRLLTDRGGVVRSRVIAECGFSRRVVEAAQRDGLITRPRRGWIAAEDAEKTVVGAARLGVVLTCLTQAGLLGLWVHDHSGPPHFAVAHNAVVRVPFNARVHRGIPVVPRHPDALADPIENVLGYIAECEPFEHALQVTVRVQIWIAGHRVDALIGDRLVIQIDGAHHVGAQRSEDVRHDAELRLMGYHVMRVSYTQVMFDWPVVQDLIMRAVAQGLHRGV